MDHPEQLLFPRRIEFPACQGATRQRVGVPLPPLSSFLAGAKRCPDDMQLPRCQAAASPPLETAPPPPPIPSWRHTLAPVPGEVPANRVAAQSPSDIPAPHRDRVSFRSLSARPLGALSLRLEQLQAIDRAIGRTELLQHG